MRQTTSGARLLFTEHLVVKVHRPGTDASALAARLDLLGADDLAALWVPPVLRQPVAVDDPQTGPRVATLWPRVDVLDPGADPENAAHSATPPWAELGTLLARLHRCAVPAPARAPAHGGLDRLCRAIARADRAGGRLAAVAAAGRRALADTSRQDDHRGERARTLVHGDVHLGQLGRLPGETRWRLLDVDDLGVGDPAWDLGRLAGFRAVGLLDDASWSALLGGYRDVGGPGIPQDGDPWPALDPCARAAIVVAAATSEVRDELTAVLVEACERMPL